ncbi:class C sortase [Microbacterium sp. QXD-8]|uniref:Class C sortase n=1 Tax=Microbacterium psychrotolerans TaxID=3068321 RepID=A0ABU0Z4C0_9MICO|nr:class C sortase [Microbacterium sp. QXD-8]MDQ7878371.1 class C sortase [Microbacterium sp. QXD-8]
MTLLTEHPTRPEPPLRDRSRRRARRRFPWSAAALALGFLLGIAVLLYPATAAWFTQFQQSQRIDALSETVRDLTVESRHAAIKDAAAYNDALVDGTSVVAAGENKPVADPSADTGYEQLLHADDTGLMARIKIPSIDVDLPIYHGTTDETLAKGVGHLEGTALPIGGPSTHSVLTGHRGLADAELFTNLDKVAVGDTFTIEVFGEVLTYQVTDTKVVEPEQTETLYPQRGADLVTLVTCTPLGINTHRILVTGERVLPTPVRDMDAAGQRPDIPAFPWWALGLGGSMLVAGAYVVFSARRRAAR